MLKHGQTSEIVLNYVIKWQKSKRQIDGEKLKIYNIPKKDMRKFMQEGNYTLTDGVSLLIDDFYLPEDKTSSVIIIDCPSTDYLDSLVSSNITLQEESLVIHITSQEILITSKYQNLIKKFHKDCNHIFCDKRLNENEP